MMSIDVPVSRLGYLLKKKRVSFYEEHEVEEEENVVADDDEERKHRKSRKKKGLDEKNLVVVGCPSGQDYASIGTFDLNS